MFRSAMCPNCDAKLKLDSDSETIFCSNCGIQLQAEDAFVYYELKTGNAAAIDSVTSSSILLKSGRDFLGQGKHDLADACFEGVLKNAPSDYQVWKLRAIAWESRVVNEYHKSFYRYSKEKGVVENKEYIEKYRGFCDNAIHNCPSDIASELAEEFNDRIRAHFDLAYRAYKADKRKSSTYVLLTAATAFVVIAITLRSCHP